MTTKSLIITRPELDSGKLAARFTAIGIHTISSPLLRIEFIDEKDSPAGRYQAILITSANGARALARNGWAGQLAETQVIAVGPASADAARAAGFHHVITSGGDITAVFETTIQVCVPDAGPLLYASGAVTTGELKSRLEVAGFAVDNKTVYHARPAETLAARAVRAVQARGANVTLYSPRTARIWCQLIVARRLVKAAAACTHYCLSANVAEAVRAGLGRHPAVRIAAEPSDEAMLDTVSDDMSN